MSYLMKKDRERPLPTMYKLRQSFDDTHLEDAEVYEAAYEQMMKPEIKAKIKPGMKVAVGVGSRGIRNLPKVVKAVLDALKAQGAEPFVLSAMGSHGSATEEGQRQVLYGYGITEEAMGVPVVTNVESTLIGHCKNGRPVWFDKVAMQADLVIPINRVKLHTDFVGPLQSGLCKMLVIGLGNQEGCSMVHEESFDDFADVIEETASVIMSKAPVGLGVAILENAYDRTYMVEAVPGETLIAREKELVQIAKKNMPYIMIPAADAVAVDWIGKEISGAGFDPNILGRSTVLKQFVLQVPQFQRMCLFNVTPVSHGNAIGVGLFDVITQQVKNQLDLEAMYANGVASNFLEDCKIPLTTPDNETALRVALVCCHGIDKDNPRILRIKSTLHLEYIWVSEALLPEAEKIPGITVIGKEEELGWNDMA